MFSDLGNDIDNCIKNCLDNYKQGTSDGKQAALNGDAKQCPRSGGDYCLGWTTGYNIVSNAQNDLNEAQNEQQDGENNDDNNNGGTQEDDGEFVEDGDNNNNDD